MTKVTPLPALLCLALAVSGCSYMHNHMSGSSRADFVAANSSEVLVDIRHGTDTDLAGARQIATEKCALFNKNNAVLSAINPVSGNKDRFSFTCQ
jgi:hypothetical protein